MGKPDPIFFTVEVMQEFGWTYQQLQDQPQLLLDVISIKLAVVGNIRQKREKEAERRLNRRNA